MTLKNKFKNRIVMPVMAAAMATAFTITGANHSVEAATRANNFTKWERSAKTAETHAGRKRRSSTVGTVSVLGGDEIVITASDNTSYTVITSKATVMKGSETVTPYIVSTASIHVGDKVVVRGKVIGTAITAKSILDEAI